MRWYSELQALHAELHQRGLQILAFPCNQFLSQEPQGSEKIEVRWEGTRRRLLGFAASRRRLLLPPQLRPDGHTLPLQILASLLSSVRCTLPYKYSRSVAR